MIADKLLLVKKQMNEACARSARNVSELQLVAVSKKKSFMEIEEAYNLGLHDFGENYVQELHEKIELNGGRLAIKWHYIGHLQSNKVKDVIGQVELIHSIDRLKILKLCNEKARELGVQQKVLLQVNLIEEETKGGFSASELEELIQTIDNYGSLKICGLMFFPPQESEKMLRIFYKDASYLFSELKEKLPVNLNDHFNVLSMGTTHDYPIAIEEGSTLLRIGSAIFGERN